MGRRHVFTVGALLTAVGLLLLVLPTFADAQTVTSTAPVRIAANTDPGDWARVAEVGFNVFDVDPGDDLDDLPRGTRAMVWIGAIDCEWDVSRSLFEETVHGNATDSRVWGYYLADQPTLADCPEIADEMASRAAFIRRVNKRHKVYAVAPDLERTCRGGCLEAFRQMVRAVDYLGLNPYPCRVGKELDKTAIPMAVTAARALLKQVGQPASKLVPVYQTFGQVRVSEPTWRLPTALELELMLLQWSAVLPAPAAQMAYSWGHQVGAEPTLVDAPDLQAVLRRHHLGATGSAPPSVVSCTLTGDRAKLRICVAGSSGPPEPSRPMESASASPGAASPDVGSPAGPAAAPTPVAAVALAGRLPATGSPIGQTTAAGLALLLTGIFTMLIAQNWRRVVRERACARP